MTNPYRKAKTHPITQLLLCLGMPGSLYFLALRSIWSLEPAFEGRVTLTVWASIGYVLATAAFLAMAQPWNRENWR